MARLEPATRTALLLAFVGVALIGFVVGGWLGPTPAPVNAATGYGAIPLGYPEPGHHDNNAMLLTGCGLVLAALAVFWRSWRARPLRGLRDPVTGLYTGAYLAEVLPGLMARDDRAGDSGLVLVQVAVEGIGDVRRRYGDGAADLVLATVGRHIRSQTRADDLPGAPDEQGFPVFLHCRDGEQAQAFCRRLATLLRSEQIDWRGDAIKVSARTTVVVREPGEPLETLQRRATQDPVQA